MCEPKDYLATQAERWAGAYTAIFKAVREHLTHDDALAHDAAKAGVAQIYEYAEPK